MTSKDLVASETKACSEATTSSAASKTDTSSIADHNDAYILLLIRLLYFSYFLASGCLEPFLPVYYQSRGYGGQIIGAIGSISPFTSFLVAPIWGAISDRRGSPFGVIYITAFVSLLGLQLLQAVQDPRAVMVIVCLRAAFSAPVRPLMDALVMENLGDRKQFGKLRLWSLIGTGVATSIMGRFIRDTTTNTTSHENESTSSMFASSESFQHFLASFYQSLSGYRLLFFANAVLHIPSFLCIRYFQLRHQEKRQAAAAAETKNGTGTSSSTSKKTASVAQLISRIFRNMDTALFMFLVYSMGIAASIGHNFTYVRFREIGGTGAQMGTSRLFSSIGGAIMFWYSGTMSSWLGIHNVFICSLLTVVVHFAICALMQDPRWGYLSELLRGLVFGLFWSSATVYASQLACDEARATMMQILNGVYNGIGRSTGALLGGKLQSSFGTQTLFAYAAIWNACLAAVLFVHSKLEERRKGYSIEAVVSAERKDR